MLCSDMYDYQTYANALVKSILVDSASTASTVAIDNKIEQAMDLVKSHLMFAVREEVEVLKEKITELMERISQLEYENTVLRQYATQEALQQIQQPRHTSNT
ncbi:hypothetical protein OTU49_010478 [Cherax quadricarinatus]|uniref:Uncharacterized protein n=1 Tax=Cherax quadricarinatus TaxID=27406 RepID=A0AAW0WFL5_CHEQU|nr:TSC22 domain family protein 1-like isoform X3 [Cherax quadricarinatus]